MFLQLLVPLPLFAHEGVWSINADTGYFLHQQATLPVIVGVAQPPLDCPPPPTTTTW